MPARLSPTAQKLFRTVPNLGLSSAKNVDVRLFLEHCTKATIEEALTEFAARVCYNSVKRMGSAPTFVEGILKSGHLSTLEHGSLVIKTPVAQLEKRFWWRDMMQINRFFDIFAGNVAGNMRSWLEYVSNTKETEFSHAIMTILPSAFAAGSYQPVEGLYEFIEQAPVNIPSFEGGTLNVYLLGVNRGTLDFKLGGVNDRNILEWGRFVFLIEGVSRSLTHQFVRHRGFSFSQESQRYVDFQKGNVDKNYPPFIFPEGMTTEQDNKLFEAYRASVLAYEDLRKLGLKKEDARFVLPNAASTRLVASANVRELAHFLDLRCAKDAQWEIRRMAREMARIAYMAAPFKQLERVMAAHEIEL
jgi:flavin-dependent thymidylate synthase